MRLQAQPIEGKANEALIRFLAEMLDVSRSKVIITHGQTSKRKLVEVTGPQVSPDSAMRRLLASEQ
ncbi:hypothetical protein LT85_4423 [Collimonas arenae]|uniref:Uncharacterized protein n=1 Tax=Collimonas arenae TaxID=279058 RepID=A0A0A1FG92_9BURK|nr:hypothetical protein LT85_4423 [Collimonas arenae]